MLMNKTSPSNERDLPPHLLFEGSKLLVPVDNEGRRFSHLRYFITHLQRKSREHT